MVAGRVSLVNAWDRKKEARAVRYVRGCGQPTTRKNGSDRLENGRAESVRRSAGGHLLEAKASE